MARPAHVKVFTAEETDRAGDKGHLHAITLRGAAYYSSLSLSRLVFVHASLVSYSCRRRGTLASSVLWIYAKSQMLLALTKVFISLSSPLETPCAGQGSRVIEEFLSDRLQIDFSYKIVFVIKWQTDSIGKR